MKFHCDRCKTRYSIADERVRGKILKIRCKNCEAVISVREGMENAGSYKQPAVAAKANSSKASAKAAVPAAKRPANPSGPRPTLEQAGARAMSQAPSPSLRPSGANLGGFEDDATVINDDPSAAIREAELAAKRANEARERTPPPMPTSADKRPPAKTLELPAHLEEEWYVSLDGEQEGPFNLEEAKAWVAERGAGDELYCWCEGFDDWLPVDKVSHFRDLRTAAVDPRAPTAMATAGQQALVPRSEDSPKPLFAATMAALEGGDEPEPSDPFGKANPSAKNGGAATSTASLHDDDDDFDFDVGEASRVVKLPMLLDAMREREQPAASSADASLPGMDGDEPPDKVGAGTGGFATVSRVTGGLPTVVPLGGDAGHTGSQPMLEPARPARRGVPLWALLASAGAIVIAGAVLLVANIGGEDPGAVRIRRSRVGNENLGIALEPRQRAAAERARAETQSSGRQTPRPSRPRPSRPATTTATPTPQNTGKTSDAKFDPFAKTDTADFGADDPNKPLSADEIMKVYRDNRLAVQWCYEQALKKDPLLDISKVYVYITVAPTGRVTSAKLSKASTTPLGQCLITRIRRWKFRKSPDEFSSRFPLVFQK